MNLTVKFIVAIGAIIILSYGILLFRISNLQNQLVMGQARQQARILYKQIILTRQWVSDHQGLFFIKTGSESANGYPADSLIQAVDGTVFIKSTPAMVTRELSEYASKSGLCWFRVTSLKPVNPANAPDDFERNALISLSQGASEVDAVVESDTGRVHRYIAPLLVKESCLVCHAEQGYSIDDIRGGLSISVPLNWADQVVENNNKIIFRDALFSVLAVGLALIFLFRKLVALRINRLSTAMERYPENDYSISDDQDRFKDEISNLIAKFGGLCNRLDKAHLELEKTQQQAFYNAKMASLGQLTSGIAHEINNPLGGLLNCVKSMGDEPDNLALHNRYLPLLDKGLRRIEHIMRQLLNFGRNVPLTYNKVDVDEVIRECYELLEYKLNKIALTLDLNLNGSYCTDVEALRQIIVNTGLNALQAMPEGGKLTVASYRAEENFVIEVRDSGVGMSPEIMDRIFDPFFTTKDVGEGTGLGLAVTFSLVQQMGGGIEVESNVAKGTVFIITLPVSQDCIPPLHHQGSGINRRT